MGLKVRSQTKRQVEMCAGNNRRRHLRLESLESRHLLSVSVPIDAAHDFTDEQATEVGPSLQNVAVPQSIVAPLSTSASSFSTIGYGYNGRLQEWLPEFSGSSVNFDGVPFNIPATGNNVWHSADPWTAGPNPRTLTIPVNLFGAQRVYTLINSWWGETAPGTYASITFVGSAGATYVFDLDGDSDVRDYLHGNHANAINGTTTTNVFSAGAKRIDMQSITLPEAFHTQTLTSIQVTDNGIHWVGADDPLQQRIYLAGLTIESVPSGVYENWSQIVSGNGQPVFNGQVFSTTSGNTWAVNSYPATPDFNVSLTPGGIRMQAPPEASTFGAREYMLTNSNQAFQDVVTQTTVTLTASPGGQVQGAGLVVRGDLATGNGYALLIANGFAALARIDGFVANYLSFFPVPEVVPGSIFGLKLIASGSDVIGIVYDGGLSGPTISVVRHSDPTYSTAGVVGLVAASYPPLPSTDASFGPFTADLLGTATPMVSGLKATATGTESVTVRWNRSITTNDPYYLERATSPDGPFTQIAILDATKTSYVDTGSHLSPSTPYYYRLWAMSNNVPSPYSAVADVKTLGDPTEFNSGPRIMSPAAGSFGALTAPVSYIDVTFSEPIDPASFTPADVSLRRGAAIIPVQQPTHQGGNVWRIPFASQSTPANYTLIVGPYINDVAGNPMNQNAPTGNQVNGEPNADRFIGSFAVNATQAPSDTGIIGIDRWWAYESETFAATLEVEIGVAGTYYLDIDVDDEIGLNNDWELTPGAFITVDNSIQQYDFSIAAAVEIPHLSVGRHTIEIHDFVAPPRPVIQEITFQLQGPSGVPDDLVTMFVSDRLGIDDAAIASLVFEDGFGVERAGITSAEALATTFAPTLHFDIGETYPQPFPVQASIATMELKDQTGNRIFASLGAIGNAQAYLDLPVASTFPTGVPTVYASVVPDLGANRIAINYWFHYPYNDWKVQQDPALRARGAGNNHEGDWEGITVFLERATTADPFIPIRVGYAQHERIVLRISSLELITLFDGGQSVEWPLAVATGTTSPEVFVARGSHASYPNATTTIVTPGSGFGLDPRRYVTGLDAHTGSDIAKRLTPQLYQLTVLGRAPNLVDSENQWALFPGRWGQPDLPGGRLEIKGLIADVPTFDGGDDGPLGPLFQKGGFMAGTRWLDPWTWASDFDEIQVTSIHRETMAASVDQSNLPRASAPNASAFAIALAQGTVLRWEVDQMLFQGRAPQMSDPSNGSSVQVHHDQVLRHSYALRATEDIVSSSRGSSRNSFVRSEDKTSRSTSILYDQVFEQVGIQEIEGIPTLLTRTRA